MNWVVIILGIVIVLLVFLLYRYLTNTSSQLAYTVSLKTAQPAITSIADPTTPSYAYSIWVYVNTWASSRRKLIFGRDNNLALYLDPNSPTLKLGVKMSDGNIQEMVITNNFPIQRWVFIAVSADGQYFDVYMDGKLVKSQRMFNNSVGPAMPPDSTVPVNLGNGWDATVSSFQRYTRPMDPQTAWTKYMAGNGTSMNPFSAYNVNLNVLQNGVQSSQISIW